MQGWPATLIAIGIMAGCLAPAAPEGPAAPVVPPALDEALGPTDCELGLLIFLVGMDQANAHLPEGFEARDAQAVLGTPAATGKGAVVLANLVCASSSLGAGYGVGELLVAVHAPTVDVDLEPSTLDYYAPALHVAEGPLLDLATRAGWTLLDGEMTLGLTARPVGGVAAGALEDEEATLWSFAIEGAAEITASALERIWHATPQGLSFVENEYTNRAFLGAAECELRAGALPAELTGATSCAPGEVVGAVVPSQSWTARFVTLPGIHAG